MCAKLRASGSSVVSVVSLAFWACGLRYSCIYLYEHVQMKEPGSMYICATFSPKAGNVVTPSSLAHVALHMCMYPGPDLYANVCMPLCVYA